MSKKKAIGYYDYTVILTYAGMLFAFFGILKVIDQDYLTATICLLCAGGCDMFDGTIAATKERCRSEKRFGIQIDSLCDLISFGILPGIFAYMVSGMKNFVGVVGAIYVLAALIRLSFFNVLEEERQDATDEKRISILGLPVTTIAVFLPFVYWLYVSGLFRKESCFSILLILMSIGFLTPIEIRKPGRTGKIAILAAGTIFACIMIIRMRIH
ncbi:MAG: CDP-alcohol phosphatidyltransferase family protein [Lachnospiraceae bacterium]|nr:CDP-alcohol phosphatidyltransferase family protein [Lachnospiraceae bacterium]